ncbi:MAG: hypothetical protein ACYDCQ_21295 [Dehalococcoidia bacterium]
MFRSNDVILVTKGGKPAGFFVPWDKAELPDDVQRALFLRLSDEIAERLAGAGVTEDDVLRDFAADRAAKRARG